MKESSAETTNASILLLIVNSSSHWKLNQRESAYGICEIEYMKKGVTYTTDRIAYDNNNNNENSMYVEVYSLRLPHKQQKKKKTEDIFDIFLLNGGAI